MVLVVCAPSCRRVHRRAAGRARGRARAGPRGETRGADGEDRWDAQRSPPPQVASGCEACALGHGPSETTHHFYFYFFNYLLSIKSTTKSAIIVCQDAKLFL